MNTKPAKDMDELKVDIGSEIFAARTRAGITQSQLARKLKTSQSAVASLERGNRIPSVKMLFAIAQALKTHLSISL